MSNYWIVKAVQYDINPTLQNYILSRHTHFKFCTKKDPVISASIYLDNLTNEIKSELAKANTTNKKTLVLHAIQKYLKDQLIKTELVTLFEKPEITRSDIKSFTDKIHNRPDSEKESNKDNAESPDTRTYLIALHLHLELNNKEDEYEALTRKTKDLKEAIASLFNSPHLSPRISGMKNFSYKNILNSKTRESEKGQLKAQFKQIIDNPHVFGKEVSDYAQEIFSESFA